MSAMDLYAETIFKRTYARWNESEGRRETLEEAVDRLIGFFAKYLEENYGYEIPLEDLQDAKVGIENLEIMPSMRALMTAGPALEKVAMANYNCTAHGFDDIAAFSELMYILMTGAGSGFSVERRFTDKLPVVHPIIQSDMPHNTILVQDSREGWCEAFDAFLRDLYAGRRPRWDISLLRGPGARLKTFGGYASGGQVLHELFEHCIKIFDGAQGRKLYPIEVFSIACMTAQIVVVGGVRRSATIALFDKDDEQMLFAKSGEWWKDNAHFAMANISAVFEDDPTPEDFERFWSALRASGAGEPGIFNRKGVWEHLKRHGRKIHYPDGSLIPFLANPCCEIVLRPMQACNLTGVAVRPDDTLEDLELKVDIATIIGTWQSCINHFEFVRQEWHDNINEERLLGTCLSGFYDHPVLSQVSDTSAYWLNHLRNTAIIANDFEAGVIGIPVSTSVTSVKPAGNSGEMYNTASGIHPRLAKFFIRRIRVSVTDPVAQFLKDAGVPCEPSVQNPERDLVFSFPRRAPDGTTLAEEVSCLRQLSHWLHVKHHYTTHTASATIYVRDHEWDEAGEWVFKNFREITGLAFLPFDGGTYQQAPYEAITEEKYDQLCAEMPTFIDWNALRFYEKDDTTSPSQELVCVGDKCILP